MKVWRVGGLGFQRFSKPNLLLSEHIFCLKFTKSECETPHRDKILQVRSIQKARFRFGLNVKHIQELTEKTV